jgi:hypothetical protein
LRTVILAIALLFTALLVVLTGLDFARHGVTVVGVLALFVIALSTTGIVGALLYRPRGGRPPRE